MNVIVPLNQKFNADEQRAAENEAVPSRREFLRLGAELHGRGQQLVAQFVSELADLPPDVVVEVQARLEAYTQIPAEVYRALGGDKFSSHLAVLDGRRS